MIASGATASTTGSTAAASRTSSAIHAGCVNAVPTTSQPAAGAAATTAPPRKPEAPVTRSLGTPAYDKGAQAQDGSPWATPSPWRDAAPSANSSNMEENRSSGTAAGSTKRSKRDAVGHGEDHRRELVERHAGIEAARLGARAQHRGHPLAHLGVALLQLDAEGLVARRVQRRLEEQPAPLRVAGEVVDEVAPRRARLDLGRLVGAQRAVHLVQPVGEAHVEHRQEQLLLGAEVRVHRALGEAGVGGDLVDRRLRQPAAREDAPGGVQQAGTRVFLALLAR